MKKIPDEINELLEEYVSEMKKVYGTVLHRIILYGSYARGDFRPDSDIDIIILLNLDDMDVLEYNDQLFDATYDFNEANQVEIMPYAKSKAHFRKWVENYPFYANINREGVVLYDAA